MTPEAARTLARQVDQLADAIVAVDALLDACEAHGVRLKGRHTLQLPRMALSARTVARRLQHAHDEPVVAGGR